MPLNDRVRDAVAVRSKSITTPGGRDLQLRSATTFINNSVVKDLTYPQVLSIRKSTIFQYRASKRTQLYIGRQAIASIPAHELVEIINPSQVTCVIGVAQEYLCLDPVGAYLSLSNPSFADGDMDSEWIEPPSQGTYEGPAVGRYILLSVVGLAVGTLGVKVEGRSKDSNINTITPILYPETIITADGDYLIENDTLEKWPKQRRVHLRWIGLTTADSIKCYQLWNNRIVAPDFAQPGPTTRVDVYASGSVEIESSGDYADMSTEFVT